MVDDVERRVEILVSRLARQSPCQCHRQLMRLPNSTGIVLSPMAHLGMSLGDYDL